MVEIIKAYRQSLGAMRFIGKKYGNEDRVDGMFGAKWGEWFQNGWFDVIEKQIECPLNETYEDGDAYIGLMRDGHGGPFEYWIGCFMPYGTVAPDGFEYIDFTESNLGVCWLYGKEADVYLKEGECAQRLMDEGFKLIGDWCFERYGCPRFTTPDEKGNIILDICFFVQ